MTIKNGTLALARVSWMPFENEKTKFSEATVEGDQPRSTGYV
jgi:hypothetical protein